MQFLTVKLVDKEKYEYIYYPTFNLLLPSEIASTNPIFYNKIMNFLSRIKTPESEKISKEVKFKLANVRKLLLETTENCNLRCRYCVYSGKFLDRRKHSSKFMDWKTAKDSIDFFFDWIIKNEKMRYYPYVFTIGFYGGEPLLNFELVRKSVLYSKELVRHKFGNAELNFSITTNGLLLDNSKIDFLVENDFWLLLSLDGPPDIHDRNKGKGSFNKLFETIITLYKRYPEYYQRKVAYSIVYAKDTDLKRIVEFFSQEIFENCYELNFGYVVDSYSTLRFPKKGLNEELVIENIKEKKKNGFELKKIEEEVVKAYYLNINLKSLRIQQEDKNHSSCILGEKCLFVTTRGEFLGCEKTGNSFKIGSLRMGYNFKTIQRLEKEWRNKTRMKCKECVAQAFCNACFATAGFEGRINLSKYCNERIQHFFQRVGDHIEYQKISK